MFSFFKIPRLKKISNSGVTSLCASLYVVSNPLATTLHAAIETLKNYRGEVKIIEVQYTVRSIADELLTLI